MTFAAGPSESKMSEPLSIDDKMNDSTSSYTEYALVAGQIILRIEAVF